jgi:hypothetical protein
MVEGVLAANHLSGPDAEAHRRTLMAAVSDDDDQDGGRWGRSPRRSEEGAARVVGRRASGAGPAAATPSTRTAVA